MKRTHWITPIGILVTLFVFNVAASPGGCGGSEPKPTQTTTTPATEEPAPQTSQSTQPTQPTVADATKTEQPPAVKPPDTTTKPPEPVVVPTKSLITTNVRNATLDPLLVHLRVSGTSSDSRTSKRALSGANRYPL